MAADVSIAMSVKDNLSAAIVSMRNSMTAYRRDITGLGQELDQLNDRKTTVKVDMDKAVSDVKAAKAAYAALGKEGADAARLAAAEEEWRKAELNLESLRNEYSLVSRQVKETTKAFEDASGAISKAENRVDGSGLLSALGKAGLMDMAGDTAKEWADSFVGSVFGSDAGTLVSSGLSGIASGAAMGSLAGPVGTVVGAAVGGTLGLLSGGSQVFQAQDDAFKAYYADLYDTANAETGQSIASGSSIAAGREKDLISFSTLFGDRDTAEQYLAELVDMANTTPFLYDDLTAMSKTLATYGYRENDILPVLQTVGDAGAALGMSTSDMSAVATALGRMKSSDKATREYLDILNDRGIGVYGYLAESKGLSIGQTYDKISKGEISGTEAVQLILDTLSKDTASGGFAGSMLEQSKTFEGLTSTLEGLKQEVDNAGGEGYNQERAQGLQAEIDAYGGALGEAMSALNTVSGQTQAMLDNLKEQYEREALSAVLLGDQSGKLFDDEARASLDQLRVQYEEASAAYEESVRLTGEGNLEAGLKMESLKEQAIALASLAYDSSQEVQTLQEVELEEIAAIRELTAKFDGWTNSYRLEQERTKGMIASEAMQENPIMAIFTSGPDYDPDYNLVDEFLGPSHAFGLERVPYDNYPALLHEGERVLTAREVREQEMAQRWGWELAKHLVTSEAMQENPITAIFTSGPDYNPVDGFLGSSHALGLERVPYDNYPALLHEGERVLTAREVREQEMAQRWGWDLTKHLVTSEAMQENPITAIFTSGPDYDPDYNLVDGFLGPSHAFGLERVPYDDYPALLHEGEQVLTAREVREREMIQSRAREWAALLSPERDSLSRRTSSADRDEPPGQEDPTDESARDRVQIVVNVSGNTFGAGMDEAAVAKALADQILLQIEAGGGR